jgi:hypothetical protein
VSKQIYFGAPVDFLVYHIKADFTSGFSLDEVGEFPCVPIPEFGDVSLPDPSNGFSIPISALAGTYSSLSLFLHQTVEVFSQCSG